MAMLNNKQRRAVAYLQFHHSEAANRSRVWRIHANDEFDIGRKQVQDIWGTVEPAVSTHHVRFRCVVFEDEDDQTVPPLVYGRIVSSNAVLWTCPGSNNPGSAITLSKSDGDVLLNENDTLQLTPQISLSFHYSEHTLACINTLDNVQQAEVKRFAAEYQVTGRILGTGGHASVFAALKCSNHRQIACKVVPKPCSKTRLNQAVDIGMFQEREGDAVAAQERELRIAKKRETLAREYNILKDLSHPNIITLENVYCATYNIYIFQELITGGDLLSYIELKGILTEPQTAVIVRQILSAVEYLHDHHIVHRDIKPENILMTSWRDGARVVLTDFGQARTIGDARSASKQTSVFRMQSVVGTYGYTAPEVYHQLKRSSHIEEGYSKAIDIWSVGCVTATLLTSEPVFGQENHDIITCRDDAMAWDLRFMDESSSWRTIGRKAKAFTKGCLSVDETKRLTAKQALHHTWLTNRHYAMELEDAHHRAVRD